MPSYRDQIEVQISRKKNLVSKLEADITALERTLRILETEQEKEPVLFKPSGIRQVIESIVKSEPVEKTPPSIPNACEEVLKQAGKPLNMQQIIPLIRALGCSAAVPSVRGTLYGLVKQKKRFKLARPGVFALIGWTLIDDNPFDEGPEPEEDHLYEEEPI
ncbi:MAG: hypothetical protein A3H49_08715 [Nitrospirae bacterium RIFCSPLOWO2_02_FULL_62_14]|nr:MAG: hypothetical protein A3H49_08715 [Nitrospirae bacterium RIFCSPLOWO2_02_FULL_62_14]